MPDASFLWCIYSLFLSIRDDEKTKKRKKRTCREVRNVQLVSQSWYETQRKYYRQKKTSLNNNTRGGMVIYVRKEKIK